MCIHGRFSVEQRNSCSTVVQTRASVKTTAFRGGPPTYARTKIVYGVHRTRRAGDAVGRTDRYLDEKLYELLSLQWHARDGAYVQPNVTTSARDRRTPLARQMVRVAQLLPYGRPVLGTAPARGHSRVAVKGRRLPTLQKAEICAVGTPLVPADLKTRKPTFGGSAVKP